MKTTITFFFMVLFTGFVLVHAQKNQSTMDKLRATTWWNGPLPKYVSYIKFSKTKCLFTTKYEGELGTKVYNPNIYYLSNTIDTVFDRSKAGKISDGKYIIDGAVREIVKLDATDFWYKVIYPMVNVGPNYIFKWTAVPDKGIPWKDE